MQAGSARRRLPAESSSASAVYQGRASRFAFDPRATHARFVVVDNLWHNAVVWDVPGAAEMLRQVETWPLAFEAGEVRVYRNPDR